MSEEGRDGIGEMSLCIYILMRNVKRRNQVFSGFRLWRSREHWNCNLTQLSIECAKVKERRFSNGMP